MNLFIDTNVFLSFYHLTGEQLEELRKLAVLVRQRKVRLLLPDQVVDEYWRNREGKIADAMKKLREQHLRISFPQICKDYPEYPRMRELEREFDGEYNALLEKLTADIETHKLKADEIIGELVGLADRFPVAGEVVTRAERRQKLGNPPGKKGSLGDAINWEILLEDAPDGEDLHFVTEDGDYASPLNADEFDGFLIREWENQKQSTLFYYKRLSAFFRQHFPHIKFAAELEKEVLIQEFGQRVSFTHTHEIVAKLERVDELSDAQANAIVSAALTNDQVYRILNDPDVKRFLLDVVGDREAQIDPDNLQELYNLFEDEGDE